MTDWERMELEQKMMGAQQAGLNTPRHIPLRVQLMEQKQQHEREIQRITQLLELMDNNPAIEQFINLQRGYTF